MKPVIGIVFGEDPALGVGSKCMLNSSYIQAVADAGGIPLPIPVTGDASRALDYIDLLDGLLLPGGEDVTPWLFGEEPVPQVTYVMEDTDRMELEMLRLARERQLPVLGICRGIQLLAVAMGGRLYQDLPSQHPGGIAHKQSSATRSQLSHSAAVEPGSLLERLLGEEPLRVNSFHHQAVKEVPAGFRATVTAPDGIIEAMESDDGTMLAVQWHPELLVERYPRFRALFRYLVERAAEGDSAPRRG